MSMLRTVEYCLTSLALLVVACAPEVDTATPPPAETVGQEASESAVAETLRPADLLRNGLKPFPGEALLVGGQPTPAQLEKARDLGYKTVINLRGAEEEGNTDPAQVESLGMSYIAIPIKGAADMTEEKARALAEALETAESPVMLHCASGNRVGGLLAMKAYYVDGSSPEEALRVGKAAGMTRLEPAVREKLGLPAG
jgi:uncharacterized protein (TIGR01244 family)